MLSPEVVIAKLPRHVWHLRDDYEAVKSLADTAARKPPLPKEYATTAKEEPLKWVKIVAILASLEGFEPTTRCLEGSRSVQLSYRDAWIECNTMDAVRSRHESMPSLGS